MIQIKEMTKEEKMKMYLTCTKKELAGMLIENERIRGELNKPYKNPYVVDFDKGV